MRLSLSPQLFRAFALGLVSVALGGPAAAQQATPPKAGDKIAGSYICVFRPGMTFTGGTASAAASAASQAGGTLSFVYESALRGFAARMSAEAAARMPQRNLNIAYCEQDQVVTLPASVAATGKGGSTISAQAETVPWGVARVGGGKTGTFANRAWVIDTGIALTHPDLNVDATKCKSFIFKSTSCADGNGHGTHVAGTIAAKLNGSGVVGVAPGAVVTPVRVLDNRGSGSISGVIAGVDWVAKNGVLGDVANMSLGGGVSTSLDAAVATASKLVFFVVAAGNDAALASNFSPARVEGTNVFTVSAYDSANKFATFSNFGNPPVDWAAPGVSITSTWLNGGYNTISGTSMATPHVAGLLLYGRARMVADTTNVLTGDPDGTVDKMAILGN